MVDEFSRDYSYWEEQDAAAEEEEDDSSSSDSGGGSQVPEDPSFGGGSSGGGGDDDDDGGSSGGGGSQVPEDPSFDDDDGGSSGGGGGGGSSGSGGDDDDGGSQIPEDPTFDDGDDGGSSGGGGGGSQIPEDPSFDDDDSGSSGGGGTQVPEDPAVGSDTDGDTSDSAIPPGTDPGAAAIEGDGTTEPARAVETFRDYGLAPDRAVSRAVRSDPDVAQYAPGRDLEQIGENEYVATVQLDSGQLERRRFTVGDREVSLMGRREIDTRRFEDVGFDLDAESRARESEVAARERQRWQSRAVFEDRRFTEIVDTQGAEGFQDRGGASDDAVRESARDFEERVLSENPGLRPRDVIVSEEDLGGGRVRLVAELTETAKRRRAKEKASETGLESDLEDQINAQLGLTEEGLRREGAPRVDLREGDYETVVESRNGQIRVTAELTEQGLQRVQEAQVKAGVESGDFERQIEQQVNQQIQSSGAVEGPPRDVDITRRDYDVQSTDDGDIRVQLTDTGKRKVLRSKLQAKYPDADPSEITFHRDDDGELRARVQVPGQPGETEEQFGDLPIYIRTGGGTTGSIPSQRAAAEGSRVRLEDVLGDAADVWSGGVRDVATWTFGDDEQEGAVGGSLVAEGLRATGRDEAAEQFEDNLQGFGRGIIIGAGEIVNVPGVAVGVKEVGEYVGHGAIETAEGRGGEFADRSGEAAGAALEAGIEQFEESPGQTTGLLVGSLGFSTAAISGAGKAGRAAGRARAARRIAREEGIPLDEIAAAEGRTLDSAAQRATYRAELARRAGRGEDIPLIDTPSKAAGVAQGGEATASRYARAAAIPIQPLEEAATIGATKVLGRSARGRRVLAKFPGERIDNEEIVIRELGRAGRKVKSTLAGPDPDSAYRVGAGLVPSSRPRARGVVETEIESEAETTRGETAEAGTGAIETELDTGQTRPARADTGAVETELDTGRQRPRPAERDPVRRPRNTEGVTETERERTREAGERAVETDRFGRTEVAGFERGAEGADARADAATEPEIDVEIDNRLDTEIGTEIEAEIDAETEAETEAEIEAEAEAEAEAEVEAEAEAEAELEAELEAAVEAELEAELETGGPDPVPQGDRRRDPEGGEFQRFYEAPIASAAELTSGDLDRQVRGSAIDDSVDQLEDLDLEI